MPTPSLITNSISVTDDSDEEDYVRDEDYNYENNPMAEFETKLDYIDRVERATDAFSEFFTLKSAVTVFTGAYRNELEIPK